VRAHIDPARIPNRSRIVVVFPFARVPWSDLKP